MIKTIKSVLILATMVSACVDAAGVIDSLKANIKDKLKPSYQSSGHYSTPYGAATHYTDGALDYSSPYSNSLPHYSSYGSNPYGSHHGYGGHGYGSHGSPYGSHGGHGGLGLHGSHGMHGVHGGHGVYGHHKHDVDGLYDYDRAHQPLPYGHSHHHNPYYPSETVGHGLVHDHHHGGLHGGLRNSRYGHHSGGGSAAASAAAAGSGGAAASAAAGGAAASAAAAGEHSHDHHHLYPEVHGHDHIHGLDHLNVHGDAVLSGDLGMHAHHIDSTPHIHGHSTSEHIEHVAPEVDSAVSAASGTFSTDDRGVETTSYQRSTEHVQNEEKGHVDDDHYYNAQSYGKTHDDNLHEAFDKDDEDYEQTATGFRKKKRKENYVKTHNKATRETGSGVVAKDKHRSGYKKSSNKLIENVDQKTHREGAGILHDESSNTSQNIDDEDEDFYNSDGLHAGQSLASSATAAASKSGAASAAAGPDGVSSSAAASGGR